MGLHPVSNALHEVAPPISFPRAGTAKLFIALPTYATKYSASVVACMWSNVAYHSSGLLKHGITFEVFCTNNLPYHTRSYMPQCPLGGA